MELIPIDVVLSISPRSLSLSKAPRFPSSTGQPLHHAVERHSNAISVLIVLIEKGAVIDACECEDHPTWALFHFMGLGTALHKAAELGKVDVVRYLISKGADRRIKDANGRTAMDCAQMLNQWQVVDVLEKPK